MIKWNKDNYEYRIYRNKEHNKLELEVDELKELSRLNKELRTKIDIVKGIPLDVLLDMVGKECPEYLV